MQNKSTFRVSLSNTVETYFFGQILAAFALLGIVNPEDDMHTSLIALCVMLDASKLLQLP